MVDVIAEIEMQIKFAIDQQSKTLSADFND